MTAVTIIMLFFFHRNSTECNQNAPTLPTKYKPKGAWQIKRNFHLNLAFLSGVRKIYEGIVCFNNGFQIMKNMFSENSQIALLLRNVNIGHLPLHNTNVNHI